MSLNSVLIKNVVFFSVLLNMYRVVSYVLVCNGRTMHQGTEFGHSR